MKTLEYTIGPRGATLTVQVTGPRGSFVDLMRQDVSRRVIIEPGELKTIKLNAGVVTITLGYDVQHTLEEG